MAVNTKKIIFLESLSEGFIEVQDINRAIDELGKK
jgi:hypothetical protein